MMTLRFPLLRTLSLLLLELGACVPPGRSAPSDAGPSQSGAFSSSTFRPSQDVMTAPFEDNFDRMGSGGDARPHPTYKVAATPGAADGAALDAETPDDLGADWAQAGRRVWRIENGRLCAQNARNQGVWLKRTLPVNAQIEFDAVSYSDDGDLKAEVWGDGQSGATAVSYTNATSYLVVFGGWKNTLHVLARLNEHGADRAEVLVDKRSDDPRSRPVNPGQTYRFRIERRDGRTVRWFVDGAQMLMLEDPAPLAGVGHDHFGFNDWVVKVCFDNVRVTPL